MTIVLENHRFLQKEVHPVYHLHIDLDGVLVDFEKGILDRFGEWPIKPESRMWKLVNSCNDFYYKLDWMSDGKDLWEYVKKYLPVVITGLPRGAHHGENKRRWVVDNLIPNPPVITCKSREKQNYCYSILDIMIDDRKDICKRWKDKGGIAIQHKNTPTTISQLQELGL